MNRIRPHRLMPQMRGQPDRRVPPARHSQQIAGDAPSAPLGIAPFGRAHSAPAHVADHAAHQPDVGHIGGWRTRAWIDHRRHLDPAADQVARGLPAAVGGGEHHRAPPRRHGKAVEIGGNRRGHHHPRPIIAAEHDGPLGSAGGEEGVARDDLPQPLPGLAIAQMLHPGICPAIVDAEDRGPRQHPHPVHRHEFGHGRTRPCRDRLPINALPVGE